MIPIAGNLALAVPLTHTPAARVAPVGRDAQRLGTVAAELRAAGAEAEPIAADLTTGTGPGKVVDRTLAHFGGIDVLVHAAGIFLPTPFADTCTATRSSGRTCSCPGSRAPEYPLSGGCRPRPAATGQDPRRSVRDA
ncbi:SDR family NAD(P)-dependent oxidoreductase [Amycolatopsis speibonae]|uniref:SDR family NAD(P)-dependent oxidoreductase n=1 Tax=Amycolatopsis speibonae TaxID=1450224 RepID=A0ABV7NQL0_9PSEU